MGTLPEKVLLTRGDILASNAGVTRYMLRKLVMSGALRPVRLKGMRYTRYLRNDLLRVLERSEP